MAIAPEFETSPKTRPVTGVLPRGLDLLEQLLATPHPQPLSRLAEACRLDPSSALRILRVLVARDYAVRDPLSRGYVAGPRALFPVDLHHPIAAYRRDAHPMARQLAEETGFTAGVHLFLMESRLTIDIARGSRPLTPFYDTQARRGPHASATGKLYLVDLGPEGRARMLGPGLYPEYTERTITDGNRLETELAAVERLGYATADGEAFPWLVTVAAPVRARSQRIIGALSIFATNEQITRAAIPAVGQRLRRAADILSHGCPALDSLERLACKRG